MYPEKIRKKSPNLLYINGRFSFLDISCRFETNDLKLSEIHKLYRGVCDNFLITSEMKTAIAKILLVQLDWVKNAEQM